MRTFRLYLPWPPEELSPNARVHWGLRSETTAVYKQEVRILALNRRRELERGGETFPLARPVKVTITFCLQNHRRRDWDNLLANFKPGLDGIVKAGWLKDDNVWELGELQLAVTISPRKEVRVLLEEA